MEGSPKPRFFCILAVPRTGSSLLNYLLSTIPEMNAKAELFHGKYQGIFSPGEHDELSRRSGLALSDEEAAFTAWKRAHPAATLEAIQEGAGGQGIVTFKLFPGHLKPGLLESDLMARDDIAFAILRRRPIESFISDGKADAVGAFNQHDTTGIKPELSAEVFYKWARKTWRWYRWCEAALEKHGKPPVRIAYERDLNRKSGIEAVRHLITLLAPLQVGPLSEPDKVSASSRQDRERRYQDRVANWSAFEAAVRARADGAKLLDWAERSR
jgi:LPS sulfotransferase NodH